MDIDLYKLSEDVRDEKTFLEFLAALMRDREKEASIEKSDSSYDPGSLGWQNISIEDFLESAIAWAQYTAENSDQNLSAEDAWKRIAKIMHAGKTYE